MNGKAKECNLKPIFLRHIARLMEKLELADSSDALKQSCKKQMWLMYEDVENATKGKTTNGDRVYSSF